ncbi:MAG: PQQ-binding-like beta-propeller repeat protein [Deltaproteobacteria bacterium]|nr:PQQ-binding-like beta-propeller repeat protein [Deltaproteobacteria bacterium]
MRLYFLHLPETSFPLNLKWQIDLGASSHDVPVYQDKQVFFPARNIFSTYWYSIESGTGQVIWSQRTRRDDLLRCLTSGYLVLSPDTGISVLGKQTGEISWKDNEPSHAETCSDDLIFARGTRGNVGAKDITTGEIVWWGDKYGRLKYKSETDELIALGYNGVDVIDPLSGNVQYSLENADLISDSATSARAILDGVGYEITYSTLRAIDLDTGQEIGYWQPSPIDLFLSPACVTLPPIPNCILLPSQAGVTVSKDTLFASFGDGKLYALSQQQSTNPILEEKKQDLGALILLIAVGLISGMVFVTIGGAVARITVLMFLWGVIVFYVGWIVLSFTFWLIYGVMDNTAAIFFTGFLSSNFVWIGIVYGLIVGLRNESKKKVASMDINQKG